MTGRVDCICEELVCFSHCLLWLLSSIKAAGFRGHEYCAVVVKNSSDLLISNEA